MLKQVERDKRSHDDEEAGYSPIGIAGPLALWVGIVAIAAIVQLFAFTAFQASAFGPGIDYLNHLAGYALYIPGVFVLPVLAALWIGARAGSSKGKIGTISYRAAINAIYVSVVYLIEMFIFYIISNSTHTSILSGISIGPFMEYVIALPVLICIVIASLFAVISAARKY